MDGAIFAANVDNIEYIKFKGTVRYSHCAGLEAHIDMLFDGREIKDIIIDLEEAAILDSTALGLLAKIAIELRKHTEKKPIIFLIDGELTNILKRVCFDQVFDLIYDRNRKEKNTFTELVSQNQNEEQVLKRVIDAHKQLALLNQKNESLFQDITKALD